MGSEPGAGVGAGGLADEVAVMGVVVGGLDQLLCKTTASQRLWNICMFDDEGVSAQKIGYEGGVAFFIDGKTMLV